METSNILPKDGLVIYSGAVMSPNAADEFYRKLFSQIDWQPDEVMMFGKHITTKRKVAWFGDEEFTYTYSKVRKKACVWIPVLHEIKKIAEAVSGENFNSCLLNLYHSGAEGMGWHTDGERELKENGTIASLSFGAERTFQFRHKLSGELVSIWLENGSVLQMKGETQRYWQHRLPVATKVKSPRINLTFRTIVR